MIAARTRRRTVTRRDIQIALGVLWLLDAVLQAQPFMFTRAFATHLIAGVGQGQPGFVSGPVHLGSVVIGADPVLWNVLFAGIQVLLGIGLLVRRTARVALAASIGWALGVWYLGEGLSGLASGHASLITGAPGSALLYVVLAAAAWPRGGASEQPPASRLVAAWALLWTGAAISFLVGVGALSRKTRTWAVTTGLGLTLAIWVIGQDLGQLYSGQATDPNSAPLIALMAVVLLARPRNVGAAGHTATASRVAREKSVSGPTPSQA